MSLHEGFTIRPATTDDAEILVTQRHAMFRDVHHCDEARLKKMSAEFRAWLLRHMKAGDYHAWLAEAPDGKPAAGAAVWLTDWPPHIIGQSRKRWFSGT